MRVHRRTTYESLNEWNAEVYASTLSWLIAGKSGLSGGPANSSPDTLHRLFKYGRGD